MRAHLNIVYIGRVAKFHHLLTCTAGIVATSIAYTMGLWHILLVFWSLRSAGTPDGHTQSQALMHRYARLSAAVLLCLCSGPLLLGS